MTVGAELGTLARAQPPTDVALAARFVAGRLRLRNPISRGFFAREADRLALACREMARRFERGGRLLAFGRGAYATDAQHVAVEFVHPVIVGKRALPALDLSAAFARAVPALVRAEDVVMAFGPPGADPEALTALREAATRGAMTFALPCAVEPASGPEPAHGYQVAAPSEDPFVHQELIEILYHTLWETVHVFLEHGAIQHDAGAASFLYPFLGPGTEAGAAGLAVEVATSIRTKAAEDELLRERIAAEQAEAIAAATLAIERRLAAGGTLLLFGNGGSATDANDWALDCVLGTAGGRPIPAVSLAAEPANLSAIANDIGSEAIFLRQLIAQARREDVAIGISTSGGSSNVVAALEEARKRGLLTVALLGYDGGEIVRRSLADHALVVPCDYIPRIQEAQASIYHVVLDLLAEREGSAPTRAGEQPACSLSGAQGEEASHAHARRSPDRATSVELFGSRSCPFTGELREHLEWEGRAFVEHDVETDAAALARLCELQPGSPRVPVLVIDGHVSEVGWQGRSCPVGRGG